MYITKREIVYLKVIEKERDGIRLSTLAKKLNIRPASAFEELNHLEGKGLIERKQSLILITENGKRELYKAIKAHRVVEELLTEIGIQEDKVCELSTKFDTDIPEEVIEKMYEYLGRPKKCPHGEDIP
ncbi:DtxR family iron (metal) dependent repressor [Sulfolobales archaeon HS-7]|nr:DtxR family iron (metal) dependent repressor [Sulfolobales archaeon HS-7]